jgi:hypothetical protein
MVIWYHGCISDTLSDKHGNGLLQNTSNQQDHHPRPIAGGGFLYHFLLTKQLPLENVKKSSPPAAPLKTARNPGPE